MKKKLLSTLICMTITVGMLPTTAYATEDGTEIENQQVITPEQPGATQIPTSYMVYCEDHGPVQMDLINDTFTIGKVTDSDGSYVCPITIATNAYAEEYSTATNKTHTAVEENITYNMTWTGTEWKAPEMTQLPEIKVKCEKEVVPAAPEANKLPMGYMVKCMKRSFYHKARFMHQLPKTVTIGKVEKKGNNYVCKISVSTKSYAKAYSKEFGKVHAAIKPKITYQMTWDGKQWKAPEMTQLPEIKVKCKKEVVPAAPKANKLPMSYMVKCTKRSFFHKFFHKARFMHQLPKTVTIGKVEKKGNNYVCKISVSTKSYAKAYSKEFGKVHAAIKPKITYQMTWDGKQWKAPTYSNLPTILLK